MKLTETEINELAARCEGHTHAPWAYSKNSREIFANAAKHENCGFAICRVSPGMFAGIHIPTEDVQAANAELIAAAPSLLDTCQDLIRERKVLESLNEDSEDTQLAIVELAWALGIDAEERWDHDSCPNNADIIREITEEAKALRSRDKVLREALDASQKALIGMTSELGVIESQLPGGLPYGIKNPKIAMDIAIVKNAQALAQVQDGGGK